MGNLVVSIAGGITLGAVYTLVSLGMVLAVRATGTFNFAHGQLMLLPAFLVASWQTHNSIPTYVSVAIGLSVSAVVGLLFYLLALQRTIGMPQFMGVIATFGLASVLDGVILIIFGSNQYSLTLAGLPTGVVTLAGAHITTKSLTLTILALIVAIAVAIILRTTHLGLRVRAAGQKPVLASQSGMNVRILYMGSWAVAATLAGLAGIVYGSTNVVSPDITNVALAAFPAIVIGGIDSIGGSVVGGLLVGILQGFVATYLNPRYLDVLTYSVLLLAMLFIPHGLFGTRSTRSV